MGQGAPCSRPVAGRCASGLAPAEGDCPTVPRSAGFADSRTRWQQPPSRRPAQNAWNSPFPGCIFRHPRPTGEMGAVGELAPPPIHAGPQAGLPRKLDPPSSVSILPPAWWLSSHDWDASLSPPHFLPLAHCKNKKEVTLTYFTPTQIHRSSASVLQSRQERPVLLRIEMSIESARPSGSRPPHRPSGLVATIDVVPTTLPPVQHDGRGASSRPAA